jgi:16S rRNA (uracil1498-N3)-methyltransferase
MIDTTWFHAPPEAFREGRVQLPPDEAHHVTNVLRGGAGAEVVVVDGNGGWYRVCLEEVHEDRVVGRILEERREVGEPSYELTVAIGIIKQRRRFETFLEKAVELGVRRIIPLRTEHGERQKLRRDRARRVLTAAMKQTRRSRIPDLEELRTIDGMVENSADEISLICDRSGPDSRGLTDYLRGASGSKVTVAVGPEGGFSDRERAHARSHGWLVAGLGPRRLRTETAGIVAAAVVQSVWEGSSRRDPSTHNREQSPE